MNEQKGPIGQLDETSRTRGVILQARVIERKLEAIGEAHETRHFAFSRSSSSLVLSNVYRWSFGPPPNDLNVTLAHSREKKKKKREKRDEHTEPPCQPFVGSSSLVDRSSRSEISGKKSACLREST